MKLLKTLSRFASSIPVLPTIGVLATTVAAVVFVSYFVGMAGQMGVMVPVKRFPMPAHTFTVAQDVTCVMLRRGHGRSLLSGRKLVTTESTLLSHYRMLSPYPYQRIDFATMEELQTQRGAIAYALYGMREGEFRRVWIHKRRWYKKSVEVWDVQLIGIERP